MARHLPRAELLAGLPEILASPKDDGRVDGIVVRPASEQRQEVESIAISLARGLEGDHWAKGCWMSTEDGQPHPDVQICIMSSRCIALIAQDRDNWAPAGDNLFVDMDLTPSNLPPGTQLSVGTAVIEITATPHKGCAKFIQRYGRDACVFVNVDDGDKYKLRGIYARVVKDGQLSLGDTMKKLA